MCCYVRCAIIKMVTSLSSQYEHLWRNPPSKSINYTIIRALKWTFQKKSHKRRPDRSDLLNGSLCRPVEVLEKTPFGFGIPTIALQLEFVYRGAPANHAWRGVWHWFCGRVYLDSLLKRSGWLPLHWGGDLGPFAIEGWKVFFDQLKKGGHCHRSGLSVLTITNCLFATYTFHRYKWLVEIVAPLTTNYSLLMHNYCCVSQFKGHLCTWVSRIILLIKRSWHHPTCIWTEAS